MRGRRPNENPTTNLFDGADVFVALSGLRHRTQYAQTKYTNRSSAGDLAADATAVCFRRETGLKALPLLRLHDTVKVAV